MYEDVNCHLLSDSRPEQLSSFDPLFGGPGWFDEIQQLISEGYEREEAILEVYMSRLMARGKFKYVTSTRILKPRSDRTYFHLVYATRHVKGLVEFRKSEASARDVQEAVREEAKLTAKEQRTGMSDLFCAPDQTFGAHHYNNEKSRQYERAVKLVKENASTRDWINFQD